jgi:uncharacterized membrane protein YfcA
MMPSPFVVSIAIAAFLISGLVKGVIGMGLPTVGIGLLSLAMTPAEAAVLLVVPTVVTNVWQLAFGPGLWPLLKRLWPFLVATTVVAFLSSGLLATDPSGRDAAWLGAALIVYAVLGLCAVRMTVPRHAEPWLGPLAGAASGLVAGATGVFSIPGVIYLNGLGLDKDELIQALGITFTVAMLALAAGLWRHGMFHGAIVGDSTLALIPALLGMLLGQWIRQRISAAMFRTCFFVGLLLLGTHLAVRTLL